MIQYVYVVDVQEEDHNLSEELAWEEFNLLLCWGLWRNGTCSRKSSRILTQLRSQKTLEIASYPCAPDLGLFSLWYWFSNKHFFVCYFDWTMELIFITFPLKQFLFSFKNISKTRSIDKYLREIASCSWEWHVGK